MSIHHNKKEKTKTEMDEAIEKRVEEREQASVFLLCCQLIALALHGSAQNGKFIAVFSAQSVS